MSAVKRSANFTPDEVARLMELVHKYRNIIENKKSDRVFLVEKWSTWKQIESEFNTNSSSSSIYRDKKILKNKYENIKKNSKKNGSEEKRYIKTKDVGRRNVKLNEIEDSIREIFQDSKLVEEKTKLVQLRQVHTKERHELEIKFLREEHSTKMRIMNEEAELRKEKLLLEISLLESSKQ